MYCPSTGTSWYLIHVTCASCYFKLSVGKFCTTIECIVLEDVPHSHTPMYISSNRRQASQIVAVSLFILKKIKI